MQERNKKEIAWKHIIVPPEERTNKGLGTYLCTYCKDCEKHFNADRFCPLCLGTYAADADEFPMAACDSCDRYDLMSRL
jgi:hypothetical protein